MSRKIGLPRAQNARTSRRGFLGGVAVAAAAAGTGITGRGSAGRGPETAPVRSAGVPRRAVVPGLASDTSRPQGGILQAMWLGDSQFDSVDVHRALRDETAWLSNQVLNKIVRLANPDTAELEGDLARRWEVPDAQTYTFIIRNDVRWQDTALTGGRTLGAEDVKWHIQRQATGKLADGAAARFRFQSNYQGLKVETPDALTVRLTLPAPTGAFLSQVADYFATVPNREATEKYEPSHTSLTEEAMPASGAFTLRQWRANKDVHVKKNPRNFRKGEPNFDGMILPTGLFDDPQAARLVFEQRQIDYWGGPDPAVTKSIIDAHKDQMYEVLTGVANTVFLHLNMNAQFRDIRLVQAMNMAVDRQLMIQAFEKGLGRPSGPVPWLQEGFALTPGDLAGYPGYGANRAGDVQEARRLWSAGGGPALGNVDIRVTDLWLGRYPDTSQVLTKMFNEALGVTQFRSTTCSYGRDIMPHLSDGTFPNWMSWWTPVNSPDPRPGLFATFHSGGSQNYQRVRNPELDSLTSQALLTPDLGTAQDLARAAQKVILGSGQFGNVVLYNGMTRTAVWNYLHSNVKVEPAVGTAVGYNLFAGHLLARNAWMNPADPTWVPSIGARRLV